MGNKVNPVSLRLQANRDTDSTWYSDNYAEILKKNINLRSYLQQAYTTKKLLPGRMITNIYPKAQSSYILSYRPYIYQSTKVKKRGFVENTKLNILNQSFTSLTPSLEGFKIRNLLSHYLHTKKKLLPFKSKSYQNIALQNNVNKIEYYKPTLGIPSRIKGINKGDKTPVKNHIERFLQES